MYAFWPEALPGELAPTAELPMGIQRNGFCAVPPRVAPVRSMSAVAGIGVSEIGVFFYLPEYMNQASWSALPIW